MFSTASDGRIRKRSRTLFSYPSSSRLLTVELSVRDMPPPNKSGYLFPCPTSDASRFPSPPASTVSGAGHAPAGAVHDRTMERAKDSPGPQVGHRSRMPCMGLSPPPSPTPLCAVAVVALPHTTSAIAYQEGSVPQHPPSFWSTVRPFAPWTMWTERHRFGVLTGCVGMMIIFEQLECVGVI